MREKDWDKSVERRRNAWHLDLAEFATTVFPAYRDKLNLSQTEMEMRIGFDQTLVSRLESGEWLPRDYPGAEPIVKGYGLSDEDAQAWYHLLFGVPASGETWDEVAARLGFAVQPSELNQDEYRHIHPRGRNESFLKASRLLSQLAPAGERQRKKLKKVRRLSNYDLQVLGLDTYIDHDTDHAFMLLLQWLKTNDPTRWQDLCLNLDRFTDLIAGRASDSGLDVHVTRSLNTLLCYGHRFGPSVLADKAMRLALTLSTQESHAAGAYLTRDLLHCDIFRERPREEQRFHDELKRFQSPSRASVDSEEQAIPLLEVLYFSPSIWVSQGETLRRQLLPNSSGIGPNQLRRALWQTLRHLQEPGLPPLSAANYMLVATKLIENHRDDLFPALSQNIVNDMRSLSAAPTPTAFHGDALLFDIRRQMVAEFERVARAWADAGGAFRAGV